MTTVKYALLALWLACALGAGASRAAGASLYERLGGESGVGAIAEAMRACACRTLTLRRVRVAVTTIRSQKNEPPVLPDEGFAYLTWLLARNRYTQLQLDRHIVWPIIMIARPIP